ncbi:MAG: redox-regulated ATPase YchF [Campylobacterales bacterium]|nr:redox-regulated ATPase YchF [Campylobacterales bacterium]
MGLSVGIVGLPNVGKSTTFNALTKAQNAESANYPFCTIEPNKAIVPVPDSRIDALAKIVKPEKIQHSTVEFVDIAGLVKGASKGEGLGNQFLGNIKETSLILHIVRCFEDENVVHVEGGVNPIRDIEIIETELILADIQSLEKRMDRLQKMARADKKAKEVLDLAIKLREHLDELKPAKTFSEFNSENFLALNKELNFLTAKDVIFGANVDEDGLLEDNKYVLELKEYAKSINADVIKICAKIEEELVGLSDDERVEFLASLGVSESGLEVIIKESFKKLGLISYFTAGVKEVRSWTIKNGFKAPQAAGEIHTDFEKGFIRAEVIGYDDYIKAGGENKAKELGLMRLEGKEYVVKDGDVMHFRFNV